MGLILLKKKPRKFSDLRGFFDVFCDA